MENKLFAYFDFDPNTPYEIVNGAVYVENFNEEIDSMAITIDGVNRINIDRPYHFVKIVNATDGFKWRNHLGELVNYKIMLIDNWVESQTNMNAELYSYEINLMNCVKLLEKIQCPNLMITHSLVDGSRTIYEYIDRYMKLYSPKIKMSTDGTNWSYDYLLKWDNLNVSPFNDTVCADMQMNEPTLREVITQLMSQVACIPSCNYRNLTFLDFRAEQGNGNFDIDDGRGYEKGSDSSDSYADTLVMSPSQILDAENEVISDKIGFRDNDNAIIKQENNLQLQTRFPIYKVNNVKVYDTNNTQVVYKNTNEVNTSSQCSYPIMLGFQRTASVTRDYRIRLSYDSSTSMCSIDGLDIVYAQINSELGLHKGALYDLELHFCKSNGDGTYTHVLGVYYEDGYSEHSVSWNLDIGDNSLENIVYLSENKAYYLYPDGGYAPAPGIIDPIDESMLGSKFCLYQINGKEFYLNVPSGQSLTDVITHVWIRNKFYDKELDTTINQFIPLSEIKHVSGDNYVIDTGVRTNNNNDENLITTSLPLKLPADRGAYADITPLVVENSKRKLLKNNYSDMYDNLTNPDFSIEKFAQYIYATMGYTIGDNKITGFSETYSRAQMWWNLNETYFDNILSFIVHHAEIVDYDFDINSELIKTYSLEHGGMPRDKEFLRFAGSAYGSGPFAESTVKSKYIFDVTYQPLNKLKMKLSKDRQEAFGIEQLNNTSDGLSDFERFVQHNQDSVNRIGNVVKSIPQVIEDVSKLKELNSLYDDKYTIFSRKITIQPAFLEVLYNCSENYVIKNYFTSIYTKYRAYEYVDYNAATVRKENTKIYCYISDKNYYDGDDKLVLKNFNYYTEYDLKNALGLSAGDDLSNYIVIDDDTATSADDLMYISYAQVSFNVYEKRLFNSYLTRNALIDIATDGSTVIHSSEVVKNNEYSYLYYNMKRVLLTDLARSFSNRITQNHYETSILEEIKDYAEDLIDQGHLVFDFLPIYAGGYAVLQKMVGNVIIYQGDYYRIKIKTSENLNLTDIAINIPREELPMLSLTAEKTLEAANSLGKTTEFYQEKFAAIRYKMNKVQIILESLTEAEAEEIVKNNANAFISGFIVNKLNTRTRYVIESSINQAGDLEEVKNECSTLVYNRGFCITYEDYDNVSAGPYLADSEVDTAVGGLIQQWQVWNQEAFGLSHQIIYAYDMMLLNGFDDTSITDYLIKLPIITEGWVYRKYSYFQLVDNNKVDDLRFTFFKDISEIINHTVQFEYYSDPGIIIGNNFIRNCTLVDTLGYVEGDRVVCFSLYDREFKVSDKPYDSNAENYFKPLDIEYDAWNDQLFFTQLFEIGYDEDVGKSYIMVKWGEIDRRIRAIKFAVVSEVNPVDEETIYCSNCRDLIAFRRLDAIGDHKYYLTFNDTKTNDVWYFSNPDDLFNIYRCVSINEEENVDGRQCKPKN